MRSYESKKKILAFTYENNFLTLQKDCYTVDQTPDFYLLAHIRKKPDGVVFLPPFVKSFIIKPGDFKNRYRSLWKDSILIAGDSALKTGMPRYFSIAQFTYLHKEQYKQWKSAEMRLMRNYSISLEIFFINPDGTLHYAQMIEKIDLMIRKGVMKPLETLNPHRHLNRIKKDVVLHHHKALTDMKSRLVKKLKSDIFEEIEDFEDYEYYADA